MRHGWLIHTSVYWPLPKLDIFRFYYTLLIVDADSTASSSAPVVPKCWIKSKINEEQVMM